MTSWQFYPCALVALKGCQAYKTFTSIERNDKIRENCLQSFNELLVGVPSVAQVKQVNGTILVAAIYLFLLRQNWCVSINGLSL